MHWGNFTIPAKIRSLKERGTNLGRLLCILLLAAAVASPSITRFCQRRDINKLVSQYQSLIEQGCYREAKWIADIASESYPTSDVAKRLAVNSGTLLQLAFGDSDEDDGDPFSTTAFDFSDQDT